STEVLLTTYAPEGEKETRNGRTQTAFPPVRIPQNCLGSTQRCAKGHREPTERAFSRCRSVGHQQPASRRVGRPDQEHHRGGADGRAQGNGVGVREVVEWLGVGCTHRPLLPDTSADW